MSIWRLGGTDSTALPSASGDTRSAAEAIEDAGGAARSGDFPISTKLLAVAQAELARAGGKPDEAVRTLRATLDGSELYLAHVVLMDAYSAQGDNAAALAEARWLADHRGRAYAEYSVLQTIPLNVAESNIAVLRSAELSLALGRKDEARRSLDAFSKIWNDAAQPAAVAAEVRKLRTALPAGAPPA